MNHWFTILYGNEERYNQNGHDEKFVKTSVKIWEKGLLKKERDAQYQYVWLFKLVKKT